MMATSNNNKSEAKGDPIDLTQFLFSCGDQVILTYRKKGRRVRALVTIKKVSIDPVAPPKDLGSPFIGYARYLVGSAAGGELTVAHCDLRPGGVLDRISAALED